MYLYVDVIYLQYLSKMPRALTLTWAISNSIATILVLILTIIGAVTNNIFWFGACGVVIVVQEFVIMVGFLVISHMVFAIISNLKSRTSATYTAQLRKLNILRIAAAVVFPIAMINQLVGGEALVVRLNQWGVPVPLDYLFFDFNLLVPDALTIIAHAFLLYSVRPTSAASNENRLSKQQSERQSRQSRQSGHSTQSGVDSVV